MEVKVIKDSVLYNQSIYKKDETMIVDDKIAVSLMERGYVQIEGGEEISQLLEDEGVETLDVPFDKEQLEKMDYKEIVQLAKDLDIKASGKKEEIIERLLESNVEDDEFLNEELSDDELPNTDMPD